MLPLSAATSEAARIISLEAAPDAAAAGRVNFELRLEAAYKDQQAGSGETLSSFTEKSVVVESKGPKMDLYFDCAGSFDFKFAPRPVPGFKALILTDQPGSRLDPNLQSLASGQQIRSAKLSIEAEEEIYYQFVAFDRSKPGVLAVKFAVEKAGKNGRESIPNTVEINMTDVDLAPAGVLGQDAAFMERLKAYPDEAFVTVLYPTRHLAPGRGRDLMAHKLSLLGRMEVDPDNSTIIITDRADYVRSIVSALPLLDQPTPQVFIEVRIMEIGWEKGERLGFNWGNTKEDAGFVDNKFNNVTLLSGGGGPAASGAEIVAGRLGAEGLRRFTAQIDAMSRKGKISLLANPRLVVQNNSKASFHAGMKIPVQRTVELLSTTNRTDSAGVNAAAPFALPDPTELKNRQFTDNRIQQGKAVQDFVDVGVTLSLTPRISPGGDVVLELSPSVSEIAGWKANSDMPIIQTRDVSTTVRVRDGDTVFIGGLFRETETSSTSGIPGLQKIPGLGRLFQTSSRNKDHTEVVFLLTISLDRR